MKLFSAIARLSKGAREKLSHYPIIYAILGAIGIILFWRGIWHTADFTAAFFLNNQGEDVLNYADLLDSLVSAVIGFVLLLITGLFVTDFIGSQIVSTAVKKEEKIEKIAQETESEEKSETQKIEELENRFEQVTNHLDEHLESIERKLKSKE